MLALPLKSFWSANRQIDRIQAEKDQRTLQLLIAAESGEGAKQMFEALRDEVGTPMRVTKGFDEAKYLEMKAKFEAKPIQE